MGEAAIVNNHHHRNVPDSTTAWWTERPVLQPSAKGAEVETDGYQAEWRPLRATIHHGGGGGWAFE